MVKHKLPESDPVHKPPHYTRLNPQPIEVIEAWNLPFHEAQVLKYIARAGYKDGQLLTDLEKAQEYLSRRIKLLKEATNGTIRKRA